MTEAVDPRTAEPTIREAWTYIWSGERAPHALEQHVVLVEPPNDRERFERMLDRHHRKLRRMVAGVIADPNRVDDVLQEGYYKAYRKLPRQFANDAHEATWLYRVVYRCCLDELRARTRRRETATAEIHLSVVTAEPLARIELDDAFRTLRPTDRAVLLLVGVLDLDYEAAAAVLGVPRGTLAWRLSVRAPDSAMRWERTVPDDDRLVRAAVDRLLPTEPVSFFEDFWDETAAREHVAARRWRRVALALAAAAVAAAGAAGVIAAPFGSHDAVDKTLTCMTQTQAGYHIIELGAGPTRPPSASFRQTAQLILTTGGDTFYGTRLLALDVAVKGYLINERLCDEQRTRVPLAPRGLPLARTYHADSYSGRQFRCVRPGKVAFRVHVQLDAKGVPAKAQVAVELARRHTPLLYVEWSPKVVRMYATPICSDSDF